MRYCSSAAATHTHKDRRHYVGKRNAEREAYQYLIDSRQNNIINMTIVLPCFLKIELFRHLMDLETLVSCARCFSSALPAK